LEGLYGLGKKEFSEFVISLEEEIVSHFDLENEEIESVIELSDASKLVNKRIKEAVRENILKNEKRLDGRKVDEVRQIV
jgi:polyribonucleotide nucleotidyltransferase